MTNSNRDDNVRKLLREVINRLPKDDKKKAQKIIVESLREYLVTNVQSTMITVAEDVEEHPFDVMLELTPLVVTDLIKALIVNIVINTKEDKLSSIDGHADALRDFIVDACFPKGQDYRAMYKALSKEMMEETMKGNIHGTTVRAKH